MDFGKRLILGWGLHQKDKNVLKTSSNTFNIDGFCNQTLLIGKYGGIHHSPITATFIKKVNKNFLPFFIELNFIYVIISSH